MKTIFIYEIEKEKIDLLVEQTGMSPASIIEALFEAIDDYGIDIEYYL